MQPIKTILSTLALLIAADIGIGVSTHYPAEPNGSSSIGSLQRYFNYGLSVEGKVRWMTAENDESSSGLARSGWFVRKQERLERPADGREQLVSIYGMSFSSRVGQALERCLGAKHYDSRGGRIRLSPAGVSVPCKWRSDCSMK